MNCQNCGSNVNQGDVFCKNCGAGINNSQIYNQKQSNMQNNVNNDTLIDAYIGKNVEELKRGDFSWCTFLFGSLYAFYRKMWAFGFTYILISLGLYVLIIALGVYLVSNPISGLKFLQNYSSNYNLIKGGISLITLTINLIFSFKFKKAYLKQVNKKVEQIKVQNLGKTNEELKNICSKKGRTSVGAVVLTIVAFVVLPVLIATLLTMNTISDAEKSLAKDTAYGIIKGVEYAHTIAIIDFQGKKEILTLEDVRKQYDVVSTIWNSDNTIIVKYPDFVCNVTSNSNNEMLVSCDVFGEKIESELMDLNIKNKDNDSQNNQANNNQNNETNKEENNNVNIAQTYKGLYAFKITDDSIYALLSNGGEKLVINYKNEICAGNHCGTLQYEYIDEILYIYHIGLQDPTYNGNKNKNIAVYSIDLTKGETILKKEYDIDKQDRYVTNVAQTADAVYYLSYNWNTELRHYVSKIFKFNKSSRKIKEIYDFEGYASPEITGVFAINNKNLYIISDVSHGSGSSGIKQFISIDLTNDKSKIIRDDLSVSYYDNVGKNIVSTVVDDDKDKSTIKIFDLNDLSSQDIVVKSINNNFYSIDGILAYFDNEHTIKIVGKNQYSIDLTKYVSGTNRYLKLSDDYSVIALVYLEGQSQPEKYKIKLKTGEVSKIETQTSDILSNQYLYIK